MKDVKKVISSYDRFVPHRILDMLMKENIYDIKLGDQLEREAKIHFDVEEKIILEHEYPFYKHQHEQHQKFIDGFKRLKKQILSNDVSTIF